MNVISPNFGIKAPEVKTHERALEYANCVTKGDVVAGQYVKLACQRFVDDLKQQKKKKYPWVFDVERANAVLRHCALCRHTKGEWAGDYINLEDWQVFALSNIFGWVDKESGLRRFRRATLFMGRKNAKSTIAALVGLYCLGPDGEEAPEVYCGATTERQAMEVFNPAKRMIMQNRPFADFYKTTIRAKKIEAGRTWGWFEPTIGSPGDGGSPHCAINDEYHEQKNDDFSATMITGMGARAQPLILDTTTAGVDAGGPCFSHIKNCQMMLDGVIEDERLFALLYFPDKDDDWTSEAALLKSNPNYGVSVSAAFLKAQLQSAMQKSEEQGRYKTKHLNLWVGASESYFNMQHWRSVGDEKIKQKDLAGCDCFIGVDLADKLDFTAAVPLYRKVIDGKKHYYVVRPRFYLPAKTIAESERERYARWRDGGHLIETPGNVIDHDFIENDVVSLSEAGNVKEMLFDPWNGRNFALAVQKRGVQAVEVRLTTANFSEPTKWMAALLKDGRLHHDGNPIMEWMVSNVVCHVDANANVYPKRANERNKIDGAIALIMALGRAMEEDQPLVAPSAYWV